MIMIIIMIMKAAVVLL